MTTTGVFPYIMMKNVYRKVREIFILQVEDNLVIFTATFLEEEQTAAVHHKSKPRSFLSKETLTFNGIRLRQEQYEIIQINQSDNVEKLKGPTN